MEIKFVQIGPVHGNFLYALDEEGRVWRRLIGPGTQDLMWERVTAAAQEQ